MKTLFASLIIGLLLLSGCTQSEDSPAAPPPTSNTVHTIRLVVSSSVWNGYLTTGNFVGIRMRFGCAGTFTENYQLDVKQMPWTMTYTNIGSQYTGGIWVTGIYNTTNTPFTSTDQLRLEILDNGQVVRSNSIQMAVGTTTSLSYTTP